MKINFDQPIKNLDGTVTEGEPLLLKTVCVACLVNQIPGDEKEYDRLGSGVGMVRFARGDLARRINVGGEIEVSAEEIATLKDRIGRSGQIVVIVAAFELLEQKETAA